MKGTTRIVLLAAAALAFAGCAHEPKADIDAAKLAVEDAKQAQADVYAPQTWTATEDAQAKLDAELDAQSKRWSALRNYTVAERLAKDVKATAERSKDEAAVGKEKAKNEASTLVAQARDEVQRARAALDTAPRGKGTEADLASLKSDASGIDDTLQAMQQAFDAGDYTTAKSKAQAAIDAAQAIEKEIEQARTARRAA
jgi:hypothetical protein